MAGFRLRKKWGKVGKKRGYKHYRYMSKGLFKSFKPLKDRGYSRLFSGVIGTIHGVTFVEPDNNGH